MAKAKTNSNIITRQRLDNLLWGAADILRGTTDAADFKNHILNLLFLKRLNDVFLERREEIIENYLADGMSQEEAEEYAEDPDEYGDGAYFVPEDARWAKLLKVPEGRAETIDKALASLQETNSQYFDDILTTVRFNDEKRFGGDPQQHDTFMQRLLLHFSSIPLGNRNLIDPDILGESYEYLIDKFADGAGKSGGEYRTPPMIVRTIVEIVKPHEGMRIHDPTCGSSGMLIGCGRYVADHGGNQKNITLTGQERNYSTWAIGKLNMLLHNFPDADIQLGDTILNPKFVDGASLKKFDRILANPPFSLKEWHGQEPEPVKNEGDEPKLDRKKLVERFQADIYKRFSRGVPPTTKGDMAFLMHMVEACSDDGMIGVIMPHGVLFRSGSEGDIRKSLLQEDLFEAVIGLPEKLFYGTGIPASILILNKNKPKERRGHVLFVDASGEGFYHQGKNRNSLRWQDVLRIASVVEAWDKPKKVLGIADRICGEWISAMERHRERQIERCPTPELQGEIHAGFDMEHQEYESARLAVHDWFTAKHPGGRSSWEKFAAVIPLSQIDKDNDFNLNISRYVDSADPLEQLDVTAELKKLRELEAMRDAAEAKMNQLLRELGYV